MLILPFNCIDVQTHLKIEKKKLQELSNAYGLVGFWP